MVRRTRQRIGIKAKGRKVLEKGGAFKLREPISDYGLFSGSENSPIVPETVVYGIFSLRKQHVAVVRPRKTIVVPCDTGAAHRSIYFDF